MFDRESANTRCSGHVQTKTQYIVSDTAFLVFSMCVDSSDALCGF
jgi:hypothetical protein